MSEPSTRAELREAGYRPRSVRQEMRENLLARIRTGDRLFPGLHGYGETVIPAVERAVLAGHDMIFLGERGQGKSRLIRHLVQLLDERVPVLEGSEVNDDPFAPISAYGKALVAERGDEAPIAWVGRERRFGEKLATPDTTVADLIGEVDPIKLAEGRYLADESTLHFGLIPRSNRGIFCLNELPDLPERVQVGLFNILEERDFQVKGFAVRLPLDVLVVASANPEDYTRRGRIITPLKDRYQSQIRTHYPRTRAIEIQIAEQESARAADDAPPCHVPLFMKEIAAELTFQARQSPDVSQSSGVSVRASIAGLQMLIAASERRALLEGEAEAVPRISDLPALASSMLGKLELEYGGADLRAEEVFERLLGRAAKVVFDEYLSPEVLEPVIRSFEDGWKVEVGASLPSSEYVEGMENIQGLSRAVEQLGEAGSAPRAAAAIEFILEGLHLSNRLSKDVQGRRTLYR